MSSEVSPGLRSYSYRKNSINNETKKILTAQDKINIQRRSSIFQLRAENLGSLSHEPNIERKGIISAPIKPGKKLEFKDIKFNKLVIIKEEHSTEL